MAAKSSAEQEQTVYHKDGSVWARGQTRDGQMQGYWEWFRKDGTKLRSGYFDAGAQSGDWTTYDKSGRVYKVTTVKSQAPTASARPAAPKRRAPASAKSKLKAKAQPVAKKRKS